MDRFPVVEIEREVVVQSVILRKLASAGKDGVERGRCDERGELFMQRRVEVVIYICGTIEILNAQIDRTVAGALPSVPAMPTV